MNKKGEVLLITGGTGSFGNAVLENFLQSKMFLKFVFSRTKKSK